MDWIDTYFSKILEYEKLFNQSEKELVHLQKVFQKFINKKNARIFFIGAGYTGHMLRGITDYLWFLFDEKEDKFKTFISSEKHINTFSNDNEHNDVYFEQYFQVGYLDMADFSFTNNDLVIEFSITGNTKYNLGILKKAKESYATTISINCVNKEKNLNKLDLKLNFIDYLINFNFDSLYIEGWTFGPETTFLKIILDYLIIKSYNNLGKIYQNKIVSTYAFNNKTYEFSINIIKELLGLDFLEAKKLLDKNQKYLAESLITHLYKISYQEAKILISKNKIADLLDLKLNK